MEGEKLPRVTPPSGLWALLELLWFLGLHFRGFSLRMQSRSCWVACSRLARSARSDALAAASPFRRRCSGFGSKRAASARCDATEPETGQPDGQPYETQWQPPFFRSAQSSRSVGGAKGSSAVSGVHLHANVQTSTWGADSVPA